MLSSTLLRVHLRIDVTHALLTHALVVSVNTGATEYSFTAQHYNLLSKSGQETRSSIGDDDRESRESERRAGRLRQFTYLP